MKNCFGSRKIVVHRERLFCITKYCCAPCEIVLCRETLLCTAKHCFVSQKIVVDRERLFCITKYCCAPCKIVLYHEKSLCIQLNIELCFALVGHRTFTMNLPHISYCIQTQSISFRFCWLVIGLFNRLQTNHKHSGKAM